MTEKDKKRESEEEKNQGEQYNKKEEGKEIGR